MINLFTAATKVKKIQQDVLRPLYTMYSGQENAEFDWLLVETGRAIARHQSFIEEVCRSSVVALIFRIIKLIGGADQLTEGDFNRFTAYVNDGGIKGMVKMLLSVEKEKTFIAELGQLPFNIRQNAPLMLAKSKDLHSDFINGFFKESYGSVEHTPEILRTNFAKAETFIGRLTAIAETNCEPMG